MGLRHPAPRLRRRRQAFRLQVPALQPDPATGEALDAGLEALRTWVTDGRPPKKQPPLRYDKNGNPVRDAYGNALGGVRLPEQGVATAQSNRENSGRDPDCAPLAGRSVPFTAAVPHTLYPTHTITALIPQRTTGIVVMSATIHNQTGELVLTGEHKYLLRK